MVMLFYCQDRQNIREDWFGREEARWTIAGCEIEGYFLPTSEVKEDQKEQLHNRRQAALPNTGSMCFCKNGYVSHSGEM